MKHHRFSAVLVAATVAGACDSEPSSSGSGDIPSDVAVEQLALRPLVVPSAEDTAEWIGRLDLLQSELRTGHLLALDRMERRLAEFDRDGQLVQLYGGRVGLGPGEVTNPMDYAVTPSSVFLLDESAPKVLRFDRSGVLLGEHRFDGPVVEFAVDEGRGRFYTIPSPEDGLVRVFSLSGDTLVDEGSVGRQGFVDGGCRTSCKLMFVPPDTLVVLRGSVPRIAVLSTSGELLRSVALDGMPVIADWLREEAEILAEHTGALPANARMMKNFAWQISRSDAGDWIVTFLPPRTGLVPRQMWIFGPDWELKNRYEFDDPKVGNAATILGQTVFAIHVEDGGIYWSPLVGDRHP